MNIGICGICGRVGQAILRCLIEKGHTIGAAIDSDKHPLFGRNAGDLINCKDVNALIGKINENELAGLDGIIDFSLPAASMELLPHAVKNKLPLVIGTTGFSDAEMIEIKKASEVIPLLISPNMSIGVNLLFKLTEIAANALGSGYDVEVFEAHHRFKKDAPSGTAKKLIEILKNGVPKLNNAEEKHGRIGNTGERKDDELGVMVMRGGDIVGEHTVFFAGIGERLELTHRAASRDNFASGAVLAIEFLQGKSPGQYSMKDVLGL